MVEEKGIIVYVDMDDVLCDFSTAYHRARENNPGIEFPQSQYGFFSSLAPLEGAIDSMQALADSPRYDPYILTAPSVRNPFSYSEKRVWVERYLGYFYAKRLIICPNKSLLIGNLLIDDNTTGKGQEQFRGELIHFGSAKYQNWRVVADYLGLVWNQ